MIYTLTLNPSIDYIVDVDNLTLGKVNRTSSDLKFPGGKGINVSSVLVNLGTENVALGYIGGFTGEFIEKALKERNIETDFIRIKNDSRINLKIKSDTETEINGEGPEITKEEIGDLFNKLDELKDGDILVLAGSIQKSLPSNLYLKIQERLLIKRVKVVVDTSGKAFLEAVKLKPFLVKPNTYEIEEVFGVKINTEDELIEYGKRLISLGAQNVIISMANEGAILICERGIFKGNAPIGEVKNSIGAGDSLVGGFLSKYTETGDMEEAFRYGIASGSASAFSMELCKKEDVIELLKYVKINQVYD